MLASSSCEQRIDIDCHKMTLDSLTHWSNFILKKTAFIAQIHSLKVETANTSTSRSSPDSSHFCLYFRYGNTGNFIPNTCAYKTLYLKISLIRRVNFFPLPLDVFRSVYFVLFAYLLKSLFKYPGYSAPNRRMTVDDKL
jgi:hypothetical protein